jgi:hypothetical protein
MSTRTTRAVVVLAVVFAAAQLVRPGQVNPVTDPGRTIRAHAGTANQLAPIFDRACRDCHSNETVWRPYTQVAPLSWLMAYAVTQGRKTVNFSEWGGYSPEQQRLLLEVSCQDVTSGKMPGAYTRLRPETRLSAGDIETICAAARGASASAAAQRRQP